MGWKTLFSPRVKVDARYNPGERRGPECSGAYQGTYQESCQEFGQDPGALAVCGFSVFPHPPVSRDPGDCSSRQGAYFGLDDLQGVP